MFFLLFTFLLYYNKKHFSFAGLNGKIIYSIVGGDDNEQFNISENGTIYTRTPLDREEQSFYNLVIKASDMAMPVNKRLTSTVQVII